MIETIISKQCPKCKQIKPISEFYTSRYSINGLQSWCKNCTSITLKVWGTTKDGKESKRRRDREYRLKHQDRIKAQNSVSNAVRYNNFSPAWHFICEVCHNERAIEYHHHLGYTPEYRLDVIPLCKTCHRKLH